MLKILHPTTRKVKAMFRPGIIARCLNFCFAKHTCPHNRHTLLSTLNNIDCKILESTDSFLRQTLLFGSTTLDPETNTLILNATIDYILSTEGFEEPLYLKKNLVFLIQFFASFQNFSSFIIFISVFHFNILVSIYFFLFVLPGTLDF